jgi:hypothetical protein
MSVPIILAMAMPPVVTLMVLLPVLVMLVSVETELHHVKVTIACAKPCYSSIPSLDIDECANNPCNGNATCSDTPGSFTCACNAGFSGDGITCESKSWVNRVLSRILGLGGS